MSRRSPFSPARLRVALVGAALAVAIVPSPASAAVMPAPITDGTVAPALTSSSISLVTVASGLSSPVFITSAKDGTGRLFIVEQGGRILVRKNGAVLSTPLLDISGSVSKGGEQGLLGLTFHPSFETNRRFYVNYTNTNGNTVIREYKTSVSNPDRVEAGSGRTILKVVQPYANHNGGMIEFGKDGYLYIGMGDGGSSNDPGNRAQSLSSLLGKMLRIDVNGTTSTKAYRIPSSNPYVGKSGLDEIWQRGLRNPWRWSFDRSTETMWIGDVGQGSYEEVDRTAWTSTGPGRAKNWGWRTMEGRHCNPYYYPSGGCSTTGKSYPIYNYTHSSNGRCAVTGGYVYRGSKIPALSGYYLFADYCSGEIWAFKASSSYPPTRITLRGPSSSRHVVSFGESASGELYVVTLEGTIYLVSPG